MKKYWVYFKISWQSLLEYRGDVAIYTISSAITPVIGLLIWLTISSSGINLAYSKIELIVYFLAVLFISQSTSAWASYLIADEINCGSFLKYLTKPVSMTIEYLMDNLSEKILKITMILLLVMLIGSFVLQFQFTNLNINILAISLFIFSLILALLISFLMDVIVGLTAFWVYDIDFFNSVKSILEQIFSGKIVPLVFLPSFLLQTAFFLPFRYVISFPIEILLNKLSNNDLMIGFAMQIFWLVALFFLYKLLMKYGSRFYEGYGI